MTRAATMLARVAGTLAMGLLCTTMRAQSKLVQDLVLDLVARGSKGQRNGVTRVLCTCFVHTGGRLRKTLGSHLIRMSQDDSMRDGRRDRAPADLARRTLAEARQE
jgi:hypothetical protein